LSLIRGGVACHGSTIISLPATKRALFMEEKDSVIEGGATLWARQTIESDIFYKKPAIWFKVWFYLVNRASHKDTKKYERGESFLQTEWICEKTGATKDQVKKCLGYLRKSKMISTRRSTRGTWVKILSYSHFQTLDNYYYKVKAPDAAPEKHQRSTREAPRYNKNDKNDKNIPVANAPDLKSRKTMKPHKEPEIDYDTNEVIDDSVENLTDKYNELINYLQKTTGVKIINWPKQRAALKKARIAGIGPGRLKERLHELYEQDWYRTNGLDWGGVISSFDKKS
jgi:hypothetical protein